MPPPPQNQPHPPAASIDPADTEATGQPGLRTWRLMYIFVVGCFVGYVIFLIALQRMFS